MTGTKYFTTVFFVLTFTWTASAQQNSYTDDDRKKMRKEVENSMGSYTLGLTMLGQAENPYREIDIDGLVKNQFLNADIKVYNDLSRTQEGTTESLGALEYLQKIGQWYPQGIKIQYNYNIKDPCFRLETDGSGKYYEVKVEVGKKLEGVYYQDNAVNENQDSLDIYFKFQVLQDRPNLVLSDPRIFKIDKHKETTCEVVFTIDSLSVFELLDESFERNMIRERAENFVKDYGLLLNIIGNPLINERFNTTDYFEVETTPVYNDLFPQVIKDKFKADEYLNYIELWFQQGIIFDFQRVQATNVLPGADHVSVEVEVDRLVKVPEKGYRDRQTISVFVKFPVVDRITATDERKVVGLERSTPRISHIETKTVKVNPKNYIAVGVQLNASNYFGDINPSKSIFSTELSLTQASLGLHFIKKINKRLFVRGALNITQLKGDDFTSASITGEPRYRYLRNLHFRNNITEVSGVAMYDLKVNQGLYYRRARFTPYIFAGLAFLKHNPQARAPYDGDTGLQRWVDLRPIGTEGQFARNIDSKYPKPYSLYQIAVPMGFGVKYRLKSRIDIGFEFGLRYTFTDYLDDVSGFYPEMADLGGPNSLPVRMSDRTLEERSAWKGEFRTGLNDLLPEFGGVFPYTGTNGETYTTINGYGRKGYQRGDKDNNDIYTFTGFHITYLLRVGKQQTDPITRQRSRAKYRIDYD
jgi:hypothetical protein